MGSSGGKDGSLSVVQRSRKHHTRSRTGCLTCRQRHLRCDEKRPICINCSNASKICEYPAPGLPLRDRRKTRLPGEQQPWVPPVGTSQMPMIISFEVDPFNALPNSMPFRSSELFHYFVKAEEPIGHNTSRKDKDCLALATQNPDALRGSLLIAALHYAWNVGNLRNYESTFLYHKVEAMRLVNGWLKNMQPKVATTCIREICTLAFTECALGDIKTADTHIDGLMRFMDLHNPPTPEPQPRPSLEEELSNRYLLLTYNFVHGVKSRLSDIIDGIRPSDSDYKPTPEETEFLMHRWHKEEMGGLEIRLRSMRLFPSFFNVPPPGTVFDDIEGGPLIECLRQFSTMADLRQKPDSPPRYDVGGHRDQIWLEGASTRLLLAMVSSHLQSTSGKRRPKSTKKASEKIIVSWPGASAGIGLYLNAALGIFNAGQPLEDRLHRRVLFILKGDLDREDYLLESGRSATSDFWFWRAFLGAFSIAKYQRDGKGTLRPAFQPSFQAFIVKWIHRTGTSRWDEARECLESVVWPSDHADEPLAEGVWKDAMLEVSRTKKA
ncbi:hypothetical protein B0T10DRAFT_493692 [Thelonectria olida]|uniref:Zn(2)-C6 fungal-type domain-containing protein n=1 Tax=Thelonectria olida TaxID=1576542 RepID=A0A9P9AIL4_9HYPO|nr:hypothetical protein B0T10DRAFT_493692 [Thelonectria olida]